MFGKLADIIGTGTDSLMLILYRQYEFAEDFHVNNLGEQVFGRSAMEHTKKLVRP